LLEQHPKEKVAVFAVWEPMLPTDWIPPTTGALGLLSDRRITQFWDKDHAVAKILADSRADHPIPDGSERNGILWDLIAVYPAGAKWGEALPRATVFNGPVVRAIVSSKIL
jgi:hypothetical protein